MRVLVTGASGQLGAYLLERLRDTSHELVAWSGRGHGERSGVPLVPIDLAKESQVAAALDDVSPEAILHVGAVSSAGVAYQNPALAEHVNVRGTKRIASWCGEHGCRLVYTSTDLVFDGARSWYREDDPAEPILTYGRTKRDAEPFVLETPRGLVARLSLMYGPSRNGRAGFFEQAVGDLRSGTPRAFFEDEYRTPLDYRTAADVLVRLLEEDASGVVHVAGTERMSRFTMMRRVAAAIGVEPELVRPNRQADVPGPEPRPADVSLATERLVSLLPGLERHSLERSLAEMLDARLQ